MQNPSPAQRPDQSPLLVATNREPYRIRQTRSGEQRVEMTTGGLVSALVPAVEAAGGAWFAWNPNEKLDAGQFDGHLNHDLRLIPVSQDEVAGYYRGFSNGALWPLCHYAIDRCRFVDRHWNDYVAVNQRFAESLADEAPPNSLIWVHDYQLTLVPALIRKQRGRNVRVAYFHHIPFPAPEVFRVLPWRREVLLGLLGADLVGFQIPEYAENFLRACRELPGAKVDLNGQTVMRNGMTTQVRDFPIAIDTADFERLAADARVHQYRDAIRDSLDAEHLLLGVDRLDYTKGIQQRLEAIDRLLTARPELRGRVSLLQIAVPSRTEVPEYNRFKKELDETVGRINGKHSDNGWQPIVCCYRNLSRSKLVAHYLAADIALVTPLRDGMNLIAKEFCAARTDGDGVLILSEFAGAIECLKAGAIRVNPFDRDGIARGIVDGLQMDPEERRRRMRAMRQAVTGYDVHDWVRDFLDHAGGLSLAA